MAAIIKVAPVYIGVMGSKARIVLLADGLNAPDSLHAPVGLPIGAEGPEEIAVSIAAELVQAKRNHASRNATGGIRYEGGGDLFGRRPEPAQGGTEAVSRTFAR
ncbi:hypothetical protein GCM10010916_16370 [Paenibacillus abyssi]|uniref:XdhC Rossmann domain-containing protein n=1 Tax=Paenibacillus abyssi TaxID=1340531 RepID=A0A917CX28_9BACL|nr:hypothetical protein GCM10010916_16370 [Paenibacillus abyssi]